MGEKVKTYKLRCWKCGRIVESISYASIVYCNDC